MARSNDFTTFWNVVEDPQADRKVDRFVTTQVRGFSRITQAAHEASNAASAMLMGRGSGGLGQTNRALAQQAAEARNVARASMDVARQAPRAALGTRQQGQAATESARANNALTRSLQATASALTVIQGPLGPLAGRFGAASRAIGSLSSGLLGASAFAGIAFGIARMGNAFTQTEAKLRPFFRTQRQVNAAMAEVAAIANRSRSSLEATADLYSRLTQNAAAYNISQQRVGRITQLASQAATLSGGTRQSQEAGLYQFSQAIGSGRLGGDELRSILENTSQLANAIAQGMGVTVGQLRKMGEEGLLTTRTVVDALERASTTIEDRFSRLPRTLSSAATEFSNNFTMVIGQMDRAIGLSSGLASALSGVANNLRLILSAAVGVGVSFAAIRVGRWVGEIAQAGRNVQVLHDATRAMFTDELNIANTRMAHTRDFLTGLRGQKAALQANINTLAQELHAVQAINRENAFKSSIGQPVAGAAARSSTARELEVRRQLMVATRDLERVESSLSTTSTGFAQAQQRATAAQEAYNVACGTGANRSRTFGQIITSVTQSVLFWQVAIAAVSTALIFLASRQSVAERANDLARRTMEEYSRVVDETTGRVKALTAAEAERAGVRAREAVRRAQVGEGVELREQFVGGPSGSGLNLLRLQQSVGGGGFEYQLTAAELARKRLLESLVVQARSGQEGFERTLREIERMADSGDEEMRRLLNDTTAVRDAIQNLDDASRAARNSLTALGGGIDTEVAQRLARATAEFEEGLPDIVSGIRQRSVDQSTLGDNARYQNNLGDVYGELGRGPSGSQIQTPQQIAARERALRRYVRESLDRTSRPEFTPQEAQARAATMRGMAQELRTARAEQQRVLPIAEREARFRTQQQNAERDRQRAEAARNRAEQQAQRIRGLQDRRTDIVGRYNEDPTAQQRAEANIRDLREIQRQLGEGLYPQSAMNADVERIRNGLRRELTNTLNDRREGILGRYTEEPKMVQRAQADIRTLQQLRRDMGEGIYPQAAYEADVARIQNGLGQPMRDLIRDYERQRQIQLLLIDGHQAQADALREAYRIYDRTGQVTEADYQRLVRNAEEQQRINDILQRRERIVNLLQGSVDEVRTSLEQALLASTDLTKAPAALGNFLQSSLRRVQQISIRSFVERITAGADDRVRMLISARGAVDVSMRTFARQLGGAGESGITLANSNRRAGEIMLTAAENFAARLTAITLPAAGATSAAPGSDLDNWLGGGSGPSGFSGSGGAAAARAEAINRRERVRLPFGLGSISSGFGPRSRPMAGASAYHAGVDFAQPAGRPVPAALTGRVVPTTASGMGIGVTLDHGNGLRTLYGHLSRLNVTIGQLVRQGETVGSVGSTGVSTGNHLHFGMTQNGLAINPLRGGQSRLVQLSGSGSAGQAPGNLADIAAIVNSLPMEETAQQMADTMMREQLEAMRRTGTATAARALGAYETAQGQAQQQQPLPSGREVYNVIGASVGGALDKALGTKFFKGIGGSFGTALEGAGQGAIASGFAKALGVKQSQTGAQIGGALGSMIPGLPPGVGAFVGGLIGGTIGGLLKKTKSGSATISMADFGGYSVSGTGGNDKTRREAASSAGGTIISGLQDIARQLGGTVGNFGSISIGIRKDKYKLDPSGQGKTKGGSVETFASEQEAIARAIELAISRGAIEGISAASQRILKSGQDLQRALEKAVIIESIPRRLLQRTNPVRFAVEELNREFIYMIQILKEAGATGEQFAQAQQLYELSRADAVKQAADQMFGQIEQYLREMTGGQSSPLNRLTVYENARAEIEKFVEDIKDGIFSQEDLLNAARNFQEASRSYKGSGQGFFADFDWLFALLSQAKANAQGLSGGVTELPPSPFEGDAAIQALIAQFNGQTTAINDQTVILTDRLDTLIDIFGGGGGGGSTTTITQLPGFGGGSSRTLIEIQSQSS